jgi:hypothetical protein
LWDVKNPPLCQSVIGGVGDLWLDTDGNGAFFVASDIANSETMVVSKAANAEIGWFPSALTHAAAQRKGETLAGIVGKRLQIMCLKPGTE